LHVFFLVLNKTGVVDELLKEFVNINVRGATIIDSMGMGRALMKSDMDEMPIIGNIRMMLYEGKPFNKTIFSVITDEQVPLVIDAVQRVVGDMSQPDVGIMFTIPVDNVIGGNIK
jgi:nitrogen regulatory protein PII